MKIYVSNLEYTVKPEQLKKAFEVYGVVSSVNIIVDQFTNRSRGFGFVEMQDELEAENAIRGLNGSYIQGRTLNASVAAKKERNAIRRSFY